MSGSSPQAVLYDRDGSVLPVDNGVPYPSDTPTLIMGGSDGTNARYILVDSSGRPIMVGAGVAGTPAGGVISIQGVAGGTTVTISGTVTSNIGTTNGLALDATLAKLTITQGTALGSNTQALIGGSVTTVAPTYTTGQINPISLTTAGAIRIDGSGVTQPISGTVTANAGSGNFAVVQATASNLNATVIGTVTANIGTTNGLALDTTLAAQSMVDNAGFTDGTSRIVPAGYILDEVAGTALTENDGAAARIDSKRAQVMVIEDTTTRGQRVTITASNAMKVDGSAVTQPVSGTVTANIGTTNGLALDATLAKLTIAPGTAIGSNTQAMVGGSVTTASPTYTNGNINPLSLTTAGALRIDGSGVTQPVSGTVTANQGGAPWSQNITQFGGVNISTGTGASGTGIPRVTVSNDSNILATQSGTWTVQPGNTANTTPWLTTINQGGNSAAVKAASTAAVATDPALVVAISPNNSVAITNVDVTGSGTLNALNATASVVLSSHTTIAIQLAAGTLIGTIVPEISNDGGTTWISTFFDDPSTSNIVSSIVFSSSNTAITRTIIGAGGSSNARVRVSAFTSGTATCNIRTSLVNDPSVLFGGAAAAALPPVVAQVGGSVTTANPSYTTGTLNALSLTTNGALREDVTSWLGSTAPTVGQKAMASSIPVTMASDQTPIPVTFNVAGSTTGVSFGIRTLGGSTANLLFIMEATTYTEPASAAQRSMSSSSVNDTSAGTGARTVKITYYDNTGAGPNTETITLNGTTAVNTVASNIRFIEKMEVMTVGSGSVNAGTISLFGSTGGAGGTVGTIGVGNLITATGDNRTFWAHHYVAPGKTAQFSVLVCGIQSGGSGTNGEFFIRYASPLIDNSAESVVGDVVLTVGAFERAFTFNPSVTGFSRVSAYAIPGTNNSTITCAFDWSEQ